ncbi:probable Ufm1-specific protease 2 [Rhagoletis pomonella]|uniref:probable Ufm1-specific protease 2 n=1 Tax=Rhagoletis pomonella TaxID=28610 RepID=UPI00178605B6|nr:probable Ufm1-specific protease 2 [Rhagoletis pomonella]XP_036326955.1 probable Ufm1-specific protease 2 [Rhagoletis pomonella]
MLPKLKISAFLLKRLERIKQQCSGCLFGVLYGEGTLLLMGFNVESTIGHLNYEQIQFKFPAELDLCGLVKFGDCTDAEAHLTEILKDVDITDNPILLQCELGTLVGLRAHVFMHSKLEEVPYEVMEEEELHSDFCFTRLKCSLDFYTQQTVEAVRREMHLLRKMFSGGSLAFCIDPTKIYLTSSGAQGQGLKNDALISNLVNAVRKAITSADEKHEVVEKSNKKKGQSTSIPLASVFGALGCAYDVLSINVLRCKTRERTAVDGAGGSNEGPPPAVAMCVKREESKVCMPLEVEAMAMLCKSTKVSRLYDILIESICRSLRLFEQSMVERLEESTESPELLRPSGYHFFPKEFGHFLSCSYLDGVSDDEASVQEKRKKLHRHFGLPAIRPYFRRANRCIFRNDLTGVIPLVNTHVGLRPSGIVDGKQYLVQGNYYYYHYLQEKMQDKGWGCAYRSLQTICSWFLLQGYTEKPVPTHREIQQYLVRIGDKPSNFVGSSQWIGSTEVSMCLQGFLNVDSRIQHVTSGADVATLASDLAMHFQTQGTPIMIGGGVLAHTIIGIDYCSQTGKVKFLILDPHYTGADDLQTIQAKGWCGWKGGDFWDKKSYYNLCMPQRPIMF